MLFKIMAAKHELSINKSAIVFAGRNELKEYVIQLKWMPRPIKLRGNEANLTEAVINDITKHTESYNKYLAEKETKKTARLK